VSGSHTAFTASCSDQTFGDLTEEILFGRKYIVVRAIADTPVSPCSHSCTFLSLDPSLVGSQTEKGIDAQKRIIKQFYDTVDDAEAQ
jgi:myo-inositol-1(or 4)-monophosphatase